MNMWKKWKRRVIRMQTTAMMITVMIGNDNNIENGRVSKAIMNTLKLITCDECGQRKKGD